MEQDVTNINIQRFVAVAVVVVVGVFCHYYKRLNDPFFPLLLESQSCLGDS